MDKLKRDEAIRRTGDMLLGGWKMLGTLCPICNTALMEKANSVMCPCCNLPIIRDGEMNDSSYTSVSEVNTKLDPPSEDHGGEHEYAAEEKKYYKSLEDVKREYDKSRTHLNTVSDKIGEKLLLGWTLLSAECQWPSCQGVPLMRNKATPPQEVCPACDRIGTKNEGNNKPSQPLNMPHIFC